MQNEPLVVQGDARSLNGIESESIHLILTSPPYWTLKKYNEGENQLGQLEDYRSFCTEIIKVWKECFRVLIKGGRLVVVVGDVCLARKKNKGRHTVVPIHAEIQLQCKEIGFDNLTPIIWSKIANSKYESKKAAGGFLGKPYEPNMIIKNDIEYILMQRKPGAYRHPTLAQREKSRISKEDFKVWVRSIWADIPGESTRRHPAPFPLKLAERLVRMFSFEGDTVLDPFAGSGTSLIAAQRANRKSIGVEIDPAYCEQIKERITKEAKRDE